MWENGAINVIYYIREWFLAMGFTIYLLLLVFVYLVKLSMKNNNKNKTSCKIMPFYMKIF